MTASVNTIWAKNPVGALAALYTNTRFERAPDAGGAPGVYVEIANVTIDPADEFTAYLDISGDSLSWYRYRYADLSVGLSGYTDGGQPGTNKVKTWAMRNMPDADLLAPFWDQWIEECLVWLFSLGVWKEDYSDVVPTTAAGLVAQKYGIPAKIRDVIRVETIDSAGTVQTTLDANEWVARQRNLWIFNARTFWTYRVWGKCRFNAVGEMTDDFFELLHEMLRVKYYDFRANGRGNYRAYIILDRNADVSPEQLMKFHDMAMRNVKEMVAGLSYGEPAISVPQGGYAVSI